MPVDDDLTVIVVVIPGIVCLLLFVCYTAPFFLLIFGLRLSFFHALNLHQKLERIDHELGKMHARLFVTQGSYIELGHAKSRRGDLIFVIEGRSAPTTLRKYHDEYKVVGMIFVDIIKGELLERCSRNEFQTLKLY